MTGLPRLPEPPFRRAMPTTPADRAGAHIDCFPAHAAFPKWPEGRHPHCHFRGLLGLHTRYGPPDRSVAQGDLCHEAPALPVTRPNRSSATRSIDNSLGGTLLHWCFAPSGRTANSRLARFREHGQAVYIESTAKRVCRNHWACAALEPSG